MSRIQATKSSAFPVETTSRASRNQEVAPPLVNEVLREPGTPLDEQTLGFFEPRFGADFSAVRIHTGPKAAESASVLGTRAFAAGNEIVFREPHDSLSTGSGRRLLAHELSHVVQQAGADLAAGHLAVGAPDSKQEREAERIAGLVSIGLDAPGVREKASLQIQRDPPGPAATPTPPAWLRGVPVVRHVQGGLFEINLSGYGRTVVGPYSELEAYLSAQGLREQAHHIVGREHLGDVRTGFNDANAPSVALERGTHGVVSTRITAEQRYLGGRHGGRTVVTPAEVASLYREVYTFHTRFRELATISDNVLGVRAPARTPPGGSTGGPQTAPQGSTQTTGGPRAGGTGAGSTRSVSTQGQTTAQIGTPDMRLPVVGGPSARGVAIGAGITLAFQGANLVLNWINDSLQADRAREALAAIEPAVQEMRTRMPNMGIVLYFTYFQPEPHPDALIQPGARFISVEWSHGRTRDEAEERHGRTPAIRAAHGPNERERVQSAWIPPLQPSSVAALRTPFPSVAIGTFKSGNGILQDVEWGGVTGFDDEGQTTLSSAEGGGAQFLILRVPSRIVWFNGPVRYESSVPIREQAAGEGGTIPVVRLDPSMPFSDVTAACVFPADDTTASLFALSRATGDNLNQLRAYVNFGKARWVRPENIKVVNR